MSERIPGTALTVVENFQQASSVGTAMVVSTPSSSSAGGREYRKGNWTIHETMMLIAARKMDDERRAKDGEKGRGKTAELRWKWVENYCWAHSCMRSQNQCNDKWDNLLRNYKKVREHEERSPIASRPSYWQMEKHERKELNLPSNLSSDVYKALHEVVNKKSTTRLVAPPPNPPPLGSCGGGDSALPPPTQPPSLPPASPPPPPPPQPHVSAAEEMTDSSEVEGSSDLKRRKVRSLGPSILQSATILSRTLLACEEKKDKRQKAFLDMEERKLPMEENRTEMNRQGFAGLISAVNNLSNAIHSIVSERNKLNNGV